MAGSNVELRVEQDADITIVSILTKRVPVDLSELFEEKVVQAVDRLERPKVLIDFGGVTFLSSAVLGKLIKLNGRVMDRGGEMALCGLEPRIAEVFHITNLDKLFAIHKTRNDAIKAFS